VCIGGVSKLPRFIEITSSMFYVVINVLPKGNDVNNIETTLCGRFRDLEMKEGGWGGVGRAGEKVFSQ